MYFRYRACIYSIIHSFIFSIMVKYALKANTLGDESKGCIAVVSAVGAATLDDVIGHMITEGTGLTRPQAMAYFEKLSQSIEYFIGLGFSVSTPLFRTRTSISGVFTSKNDSFDAIRHQINVRTVSGVRLGKLEKNLSTVKTKLNKLFPSPEILTDGSTETENRRITPAGLAVLRGSLLKFDPKDVQQGIFFIATDNPAEETRAEIYTTLRSNEINFQIPALQPKDYTLVVKSSYYSWSIARKGELEYTLSV
jgi:hypothetical protein